VQTWSRFCAIGSTTAFFIDIAVPRDVAPDVNELEGVFHDIDSLQSIAQQSLAQRRDQIAAGRRSSPRTQDFNGCSWRRGSEERSG
jgi:glutamyl-tRNA reductase